MALGLAALLLVALLGEPAGTANAAVLSVELAPDLRCPKPSALLATLASRLAPQVVANGTGALGRFQLTVQPHGGHGVALTLREGETTLVARTLEVAANECDGLADTMALIVEAWIDAPQLDTRATPASAAQAASAPPANPEATAAAAALPEQSAVQPPPTGADLQPAPSAVSANTAKGVTTEHSSGASTQRSDTEGSAPSAVSGQHLSLELAAGVVVSGESPRAAARIALEGARERWLLSLRGQVESAHALEDAAAISVRHAPLELCVGGLLARSSLLELAALLGAGVDVVSARIRGYANDSTRTLVPLLSFALRGAWRPRPRLALFAAAELLASLRRERFVTQGERLAVTERARSRFLLGAS